MKNLCRDSSLDLVRIFATFSVISVHFFLNNGFYAVPVVGKRMFIMILIRSFFMICVPLFIVLTGYLMSEKKLSKKYYSGIKKTIVIYLLASISCILFKNLVTPGTYTINNAILGILDFSAANYSWYIEMYIGLFLLIPFINLIYCNLNNKKQKQWLILTLIILTSIPSILNIYNFTLDGWWINPTLTDNYAKLFPSWWVGIYPLTYYFIGCYLKEYEIKLSRIASLLFLVVTVILVGTFNYYRSYGVSFQWGAYQDWYSLLNVIMTVLVFHILSNMKGINKWPNKVRNIIKSLSDLALGAYLVSCIFDSTFYPRLSDAVPEMTHRLEYYIIIVPLVFCCSFLLSFLLNLLYKSIDKIPKLIFHKGK